MAAQPSDSETVTTYPCRHCDGRVVEHAMIGVWQHTDERWRCADGDTLAEPKRGADGSPI